MMGAPCEILCSEEGTKDREPNGNKGEQWKRPQIGFLAPPEAVKTRGHQWLALGQGVRNLKSACEESGDFSGKRSETYRGSEIRPRNPTPESELKARPPGQPPGAVRQWTRGPPSKLHQTQIPGPSSPPRPRNRSLRSAQISISSRSTTHSR